MSLWEALQRSIENNKQLEISRYATFATIQSNAHLQYLLSSPKPTSAVISQSQSPFVPPKNTEITEIAAAARTVIIRCLYQDEKTSPRRHSLLIHTDGRTPHMDEIRSANDVQAKLYTQLNIEQAVSEFNANNNAVEDQLQLIHCNAALCWFFPLSNEQYRFQGSVLIVDETTEDIDLIELRKRQWNDLSNPERLYYDTATPSTVRARPNCPDGDLDRYEPQPIHLPSPHFTLLLFYPKNAEHLHVPNGGIDPHPFPWSDKVKSSRVRFYQNNGELVLIE
jgi:hypothetical protein